MKRYRLLVEWPNVGPMVEVIRANNYEGIFWPNPADGQPHEIELNLEEDELLALMLKVPCRLKPKH